MKYNMKDREIYTMSDGREYYSGASITLNNNDFLLLYDIKNDNAVVAIEENDRLRFINEDFDGYYDILGLLMERLNNI